MDSRQARIRWRASSFSERSRSIESIWSKTKLMRAEREVGLVGSEEFDDVVVVCEEEMEEKR